MSKFQSTEEEVMYIFQRLDKLEKENQKYKEVMDKIKTKVKKYKKNVDDSGSYVETYTGWKTIPEILNELLDILKEVE